MSERSASNKTVRLCLIGMMAAVACVSNYISIPFFASRFHVGNAVCVLCGLLLGPVAGFFAAAERPAFALVVSLGRGMVLIALSLVVMTALFGETGIWLSSAASEGVCLLLSLGLFLVYLRKSPAGQRGAAPAMVQPAAETK